MKPVLVIALATIVACGSAGLVAAQSEPLKLPRWAMVVHRRALQVKDAGESGGAPGVFPPVIPEQLDSADASGVTETYNLGAPTITASNPFFQSLGANGRACATCHEPRSGWGVSVASIQQRFAASNGDDPIFRVIDGATCDTDDVSTLQAKQIAYSLLLSKGLIRIFLPLPTVQSGSNPPAPPDFQIVNASDPYACTDLGSSPPIVSVYRRPLPAANLRFLTECPDGNPACAPLAIMWDGREPSLASQAIDATLGHAQAPNPPSPDQVAQIVNFESQLYDAQEADNAAGRLDQAGADGGPQFLSQQEFFIGINDSLSPGFDNVVFTLYAAWENLTGSSGRDQARAAIARGQRIFNSRQFTISGVNGLNLFPGDPLGANPLTTGTCTTCHDSPNVGNHSLKLALDIGIAGASPPALDNSGLPVFTVRCTDVSGPLAGLTFTVTDLGRAMITGKCADVGKFKGPILHALAARALFPQRFGRDVERRGEFLRPALFDRLERSGQVRFGRFSADALSESARVGRDRFAARRLSAGAAAT